MTRAATSMSAEQQRIIDLVIERAEQACRYVLKHNQTAWSGDGSPNDEYKSGFEVACEVCESSIRAAVTSHIAEDLAREFPTNPQRNQCTDENGGLSD